jgi:hypothetical protein
MAPSAANAIEQEVSVFIFISPQTQGDVGAVLV